MGGALGLALLRKKRRWHVAGVGRNAQRLRLARRHGAVQEHTTDLAAGVRDADIVVLAVPVDEIAPLARRIRPHLKTGALVMDVGSVKAPIVRSLQKIFSSSGGPHFVGAHPMAGSEKTGVQHARADLYQDAVCVLTPSGNTPRAALERARSFWRGAGARVVRLDAVTHDRWMALVSHLPHLLADCLVLAADRGPSARRTLRLLAAGSFRDMTRVAEADPRQWDAIFRMNDKNLKVAAARFQKILRRLVGARNRRIPLAKAGRLHSLLADH